jgi:hypothetical protein
MLICVCSKADDMRCSVCPVYKRIKPDKTYNHLAWKYKVNGRLSNKGGDPK